MECRIYCSYGEVNKETPWGPCSSLSASTARTSGSQRVAHVPYELLAAELLLVKENVSFSVLHGRFIVVSISQVQCHLKSSCSVQHCLTDCISGKSLMFTHSELELFNCLGVSKIHFVNCIGMPLAVNIKNTLRVHSFQKKKNVKMLQKRKNKKMKKTFLHIQKNKERKKEKKKKASKRYPSSETAHQSFFLKKKKLQEIVKQLRSKKEENKPRKRKEKKENRKNKT